MVRGPSSVLSERRLRADREKCSVQVSPCDKHASVTASHPAQHGRSGMVTRSEREGDKDAVRLGRRGLWEDPGAACEMAEIPDGERWTRQGESGLGSELRVQVGDCALLEKLFRISAFSCELIH